MNNLRLPADAQTDLADIKVYITDELENPVAALATVSKITKASSHFGDLCDGRHYIVLNNRCGE